MRFVPGWDSPLERKTNCLHQRPHPGRTSSSQCLSFLPEMKTKYCLHGNFHRVSSRDELIPPRNHVNSTRTWSDPEVNSSQDKTHPGMKNSRASCPMWRKRQKYYIAFTYLMIAFSEISSPLTCDHNVWWTVDFRLFKKNVVLKIILWNDTVTAV